MLFCTVIVFLLVCLGLGSLVRMRQQQDEINKLYERNAILTERNRVLEKALNDIEKVGPQEKNNILQDIQILHDKYCETQPTARDWFN